MEYVYCGARSKTVYLGDFFVRGVWLIGAVFGFGAALDLGLLDLTKDFLGADLLAEIAWGWTGAAEGVAAATVDAKLSVLAITSSSLRLR